MKSFEFRLARVLEWRQTELELADGRFRRPIVTTIEPAPPFYRGEEYHQRYFEKHGLPSCHLPPH